MAAGIVSGGLLGFLAWAILDPRHRINRLAIILVAVNAGAGCYTWLPHHALRMAKIQFCASEQNGTRR